MIVQLRDRYNEFTARGAQVVVIGMGDVADAAAFGRQHHIPFPLLVDSTKKSYVAVNLHRVGWAHLIGPEVWTRGLRSITRHGAGLPKQDVRQLGGAAVINADGTIGYLHRARSSADNSTVDDLLQRL
jgi:peroxiredoxin